MSHLPDLSRHSVVERLAERIAPLVRPRDRADVVIVNERPAARRLIVREGLRQSDS